MTPWGDPDADPEIVRAHAEQRGGSAYTDLHRTHRALDAALAGSALPPDVADEVTARLRDIIGIAHDQAADSEAQRWDGMRPDLPGRGHPGLPAYVIDHSRAGVVRGRVTFTRFHLGGNGAVHGGVHPLLFDDVLGHATNVDQDVVARTAYLKVDYRAVTPIDVELTFEGTLDRVDGRKRFATGRLRGPDGTLLAEASSLFLTLLPGQA